MTHTGLFKGLSEKFYDRIKPRLIKRIGRDIRLAHRIVDLGCGNCGLADYLAHTYAQEVTGVDISGKDFPKRRTKPRGAGKMRCVKADAGRLDFLENSSIDAVVSFWALHEMPRSEAVLREARRVLRPGGQILVVEFPRGSLAGKLWNENYFTPEQITRMLDDAGFVRVKCKEIERSQILWISGQKKANPPRNAAADA